MANELELVKELHGKKQVLQLLRGAIDGHDGLYVRKSGISAVKEYSILTELHDAGIAVPRAWLRESVLYTEYIEGHTPVDMLDNGVPAGKTEHALLQVIEWLSALLAVSKTVFGAEWTRGDNNLRNYIYSGTITGLDFEEAGQGSTSSDAGKMCAYLLTYKPILSPERRRLFELIYSTAVKRFDNNQVKQGLFVELEAIEQRRDTVRENEIIRQYILSYGL